MSTRPGRQTVAERLDAETLAAVADELGVHPEQLRRTRRRE